jgi:hypothetical protein
MYKASIGKKTKMGLGFKSLNSKLSLRLERDVTLDEIKRCVWDCDGSKSPRETVSILNFISSLGILLQKTYRT